VIGFSAEEIVTACLLNRTLKVFRIFAELDWRATISEPRFYFSNRFDSGILSFFPSVARSNFSRNFRTRIWLSKLFQVLSDANSRCR